MSLHRDDKITSLQTSDAALTLQLIWKLWMPADRISTRPNPGRISPPAATTRGRAASQLIDSQSFPQRANLDQWLPNQHSRECKLYPILTFFFLFCFETSLNFYDFFLTFKIKINVYLYLRSYIYTFKVSIIFQLVFFYSQTNLFINLFLTFPFLNNVHKNLMLSKLEKKVNN